VSAALERSSLFGDFDVGLKTSGFLSGDTDITAARDRRLDKRCLRGIAFQLLFHKTDFGTEPATYRRDAAWRSELVPKSLGFHDHTERGRSIIVRLV
jgi:hypothetical protein